MAWQVLEVVSDVDMVCEERESDESSEVMVFTLGEGEEDGSGIKVVEFRWFVGRSTIVLRQVNY